MTVEGRFWIGFVIALPFTLALWAGIIGLIVWLA